MAFYSPDAAMGQQLAAALLRLEAAGHPGLGERLAITWLRYSSSRLPQADPARSATAPAAVAPSGAGWRSGVVKADGVNFWKGSPFSARSPSDGAVGKVLAG